MKRIGIIFFVLAIAAIYLLPKSKKNNHSSPNINDEGDIDKDIVGPGGEHVYIGSGGGRYFIKNNNKIFMNYSRAKNIHN